MFAHSEVVRLDTDWDDDEERVWVQTERKKACEIYVHILCIWFDVNSFFFFLLQSSYLRESEFLFLDSVEKKRNEVNHIVMHNACVHS